MTELSDGALVEGALAEDEEAFGFLYRRFYPRLVRLIVRKTGDRPLAEDIAQETLLRALDKLGTFDSSRPLWPWLKTIATNLMVDCGRKRSREVVWEPDDEGLPAKEMPGCEDGMVLAQVLRNLPDRQRVAVSLRYLQDWESSEAASFLGLTIPAFEQLLFRARKKLRVEYGRIAQGALGLAAFPVRWLRRESARLATQVPGARRVVEAATHLGPVTWAQAAAGGLVLLTVLPSVPGAPGGGPVRSVPIAVREAGEREGLDARAERGPRGAGARSVTSPGSLAEDGSGDAPAQASRDGRVEDPLKDLTEPNHRIRRPEDATIVSMAYAQAGPGSGSKRAFASGVSHCAFGACPPVLFTSADGGASWRKLPARGFSGHSLVVPPGSDGTKLFAMSRTGLQVSTDGGRRFRMATLTGAAPATGSVAVSPAFDRGDPTMLIGAQTLLRYDDSVGTIHPEPSTTLNGPFEPVFAPGYPHDPRFLMGGLRLDAEEGMQPTVFVCNRNVGCIWKPLVGGKGVPKVRLRYDYEVSEVAFAFTDNHVYRSHDVWSFTVLPTPWPERSTVRDVALVDRSHTMFAAVHSVREGGAEGLYRSDDSGETWTRVDSPLFATGAASIALDGGRMLVALPDAGLACSRDGGITWARRC